MDRAVNAQLSSFFVTPAAQRPGSVPPFNGRCFYCRQAIGDLHKATCELVRKRVKVRCIIEYEVSVPSFWDDEGVRFHRNDASWCADNLLHELSDVAEAGGCLCELTRFEVLDGSGEPYLDEK